MSNNLVYKNIENRKIELEVLRKKLRVYLTNNKFNLRKLSRILDKNDAYLQQYLYLPSLLTITSRMDM